MEGGGPRFAVVLWQDAVPYELDSGVMFQDLVRTAHGARALVSGTATFQPGAALPLHTHNVEEIVTVLEGEAHCEVDGQVRTLGRYDTTFVRPGVPHEAPVPIDKPTEEELCKTKSVYPTEGGPSARSPHLGAMARDAMGVRDTAHPEGSGGMSDMALASPGQCVERPST